MSDEASTNDQDGREFPNSGSDLASKCHFLKALAESINDEFVFYILDSEGRFTFVSNSAVPVLNQEPQKLLSRNISETLSDHPCNSNLHPNSWKDSASPKLSNGNGEMLDQNGNCVSVRFWQTKVFNDGNPIGVSGLFHRKQNSGSNVTTSTSSTSSLTNEELELLKRVRLLTPVERQVIDLAVDGNMNKEMACSLDVAVRTVESRRSRAMVKLKVKSLSALVRIWIDVRRIEAKLNQEG